MEKKVKISNESGLHARPAGVFVKKASEFKSDVCIGFNGKKINGKSIMGVMSLGLSKGNEVTIIANGEDAQEALDALVGIIETGFGETN